MKKKSTFKEKCNKKKIRVFLLICFVATMQLFSPIAYANDISNLFDNEQIIKINKITLDIKNKSLRHILDVIHDRTGYGIIFKDIENIDELNNLSINVKDVSVEDALTQLLKNTGLTYIISKDSINIVKVAVVTAPTLKDEVSAGINITGKVINSKKKLIVGATVLVKGTSKGAITDAEGVFLLSLNVGDVVEVSYVGMISQTLTILKSKNDYTIVMVEDNIEVEDIIVTGYGNINRNSFTGNAVIVKGDDLLKVSRTNVIKALQRFDPSIRLSSNVDFGSDPNKFQDMTIRGNSSLGQLELDKDDLTQSSLERNPNTPTFMLDGFEVSMQKIYDLDMNRIASMTILKDAAATAMYGSRAANGVIVVTTHPPKAGEIKVSYNFTSTVEIPDLSSYNLMNAKEKLEAELLSGVFDPRDASDPIDEGYRRYLRKYNDIYIQGNETDWMALPLQVAFKHQHSASVEGGTEQIRFIFSADYSNDKGVMIGSGRDNGGLSLRVNFDYGKIQISNNISYSTVSSVDSHYGSFSDFSHKHPYSRYVDDNGELDQTVEYTSGSSEINPMYEASLNNFSNSRTQEFINNFQVRYDITEDLHITGTLGVSVGWDEDEKFVDPKSRNSTTQLEADNFLAGDLYVGSGYGSNVDGNIRLSYNKSVDKHNLNISASAEMNERIGNVIDTHYVGFPSGTLNSINYAQEVNGKPQSMESTSRTAGVNGILNYSYDNIYLADISMRYEGSSAFGAEQKSAMYWAGGLGINVHNYDFMKNVSWINTLRARMSYGQTGNVNFPAYAAQTYYDTMFDDWYITGYGVNLTYLGNPDLKAEKTNTFDVGFILAMFNGRLNIDASYYNKTTIDMINDVTISSTSGFTTYKDNLGKVRNVGFEGRVSAVVVDKKDLNFSLFANFAQNKNTMLEIAKSLEDYNNQVNDFYNNDDMDPSLGTPLVDHSRILTKYEEGASMTAMFGMQSLGIDPATGQELFLDREGNVTYESDPTKYVVIGDEAPLAEGALGFNLRYKGFTLDATFSYSFGGDTYNNTLINYVENADIENGNVDKRVLTDRWQKPGDIAPLKDIKDSEIVTKPTSRFMQRSNYLSLSALSLQYEFGQSVAEILCVERLRLEVNSSDLFRFDTVKQERGLSYPFARSFGFTLMVNF